MTQTHTDTHRHLSHIPLEVFGDLVRKEGLPAVVLVGLPFSDQFSVNCLGVSDVQSACNFVSKATD